MALEIGVIAPEFTAETDGGRKISLSDFKGKWVVLYFYPKDNTSGCTKQACSFRDNMERITSLDAVVLGVSPDKVKSHDNFKEKFNLNFVLIADPEKDICNSYDIMGEKSMYGKKYLGVVRSTYIISPEGIIAEVFSNVKVDGHVDAVIAKLQELKG
ncbi:MAG: thioredoxin-dependent thiol peroxidase [Candidatus Kapabacteria bacterium]|nr:thioredoxin-dependent thiol peroxidase [Ignavibacteriota bacterium]MCW5884407.1 thioredoxin-dependent thiol peroxidase [Candidatus Kapabacteria bacterium]